MTYLESDGPSVAEPGIPGSTFAARLLNAALAISTEELRPEALTFDCLRIVGDGSTYHLVSKGEIVVSRSRKNHRPSKLGRSKEWEARDARELLQELVTPASDTYGSMVDPDCWKTALRFARESRLDGNATTYLSRAINYLLITRAGGRVDPKDIP